MNEIVIEVSKWLIPPFFVYMIHPIFMGMVLPSRLRHWWQIVLLSAGVALLNLPKMIWGLYSTPADIFRLISTPILLIVIPVFFFEGPIWRRLLINILFFTGQIVGEGLAAWIITSPVEILVTNVIVESLMESFVYTAVAFLGNILHDGIVVIFARTMQAKKFTIVYIPVVFILLGLGGNFYANVSASGPIFWCFCMILTSVAVVSLIYYVVELEKKALLEEEIQKMRYTMDLERIHYQSVQERQEEMARIRHDFNNQLATIVQLVKAGSGTDAQQMIHQLGDEIAATRENPYCTIPVVNAVLTEKEKICRQKDITLEIDLKIPGVLSVEEIHLCSIFANLLDNAIHASVDMEQPMISLTSAVAGDYLFIRTVNPSRPPQEVVKGHGYGTKILKQIAEQYEGSYQTNYENGIYTAVVSILLKNE